MTSVTTKPVVSQPAVESSPHLFDDWIDPIETEVRERVREFIEKLIHEEQPPGERDRAIRACQFSAGRGAVTASRVSARSRDRAHRPDGSVYARLTIDMADDFSNRGSPARPRHEFESGYWECADALPTLSNLSVTPEGSSPRMRSTYWNALNVPEWTSDTQ